MAAYAALVSLMNDLELIPNHLTHSFSFVNKQISSLSQTVQFLIDFIESYDSHGCTREAAQVLESRIASAAHAAHDVVESHVVDQIHAGSTKGGKARSYFLLDLQRRIDDMDFVKRKAMQFKAKSGLKAEQPTYSSAPPTSSEPLKNGMVGFEEVVVRLLDILTGEPSNRRLVIPIVGMGGLGKTSLAKTVYEHSYLEYHFDVRLWATISQQYSAESIFTELVYGERKSTTDENVSSLGEKLHKKLYGRRYLIVLDDMWREGAWDGLQRFLPDNGNGSRVVVTTRLSNLATHLNSSPFNLNLLDDDKSWELFCGKTFGEEDCPLELKEIGKKIVKRCGGLPLSIVVIGGHFRKSSRAIEYWEKVASYMNPISSIGEEKQCLEILSLSYEHLPAYLKPCFLYLGIFMEDAQIFATKLIRFWIAEGFLKPKKGLSLEEVGEEYLIDLIDRNLIFVNRSSYKIHDTVRELCLKVCKKEKFLCLVKDITQAISCKERRLVVLEGGKLNSDMIGAKQSAPSLRSLVNLGRGNSFLNELWVDCSLLRLSVHDNGTHPERDGPLSALSHFQQVNLRALAFNNHALLFAESDYSIPSSISACWNLQTLCVRKSCQMMPLTLPYEIWEMTQLRHLQVYQNYLLDPVFNEGSTQQECIVLQNLYTLEEVVNLRLTEEVCKRMPNLKDLSLRYDCYYDHFYDDYFLHNLGRFNKLTSLSIEFDNDSKWCDAVLSLTFPTSLKVLYLYNFHLSSKDLTMMISSLPHLGFLNVGSFRGSEWNLDEEEFSCLRTLEICHCDELIYLNANSSHFPNLETLDVSDTPKLSEIPFDFAEISTLRCIRLSNCGVSAAVSAMRIVMEQETNGNYDLQLVVQFYQFIHREFERFQEMLQEECLTSNNLHLYYNDKKIKTF